MREPSREGLAPLPDAALRKWDWLLGLLFLVLFWGLALKLGPRGLAGVAGLLIGCIAFLFPRTGLWLLFLLEAALTTITYFAAINTVPEMRGLSGTIGWVLPYDFYLAIGAMVLLLVLAVGIAFQHLLECKTWALVPLERVLLGILTMALCWTTLSAANGIALPLVLYDLHVIFLWASAILISHLLESRRDWVLFFLWLLAASLLHWIALIGDLVLGGLLVEVIFLADVLRFTLGGSPDFGGPLAIVLLAVDALWPNLSVRARRGLWIGILIFTMRTLATLARSAMVHYLLAAAILYWLLKAPAPRRQMRRTLGTVLLTILVLGAAVAIAVPSVGRVVWVAVQIRLLDVAGEDAAQESTVDTSSDNYRVLETQVALEHLRDVWYLGDGPGGSVMKRFVPLVAGKEESYLHNGYLWYMLKFGILGVILVCAAYWAFYRAARRGLASGKLAPWQVAITYGLCASVFPLLLFALTNNIIGSPSGMFFLTPAFAWMCWIERIALGKAKAPEEPVAVASPL